MAWSKRTVGGKIVFAAALLAVYVGVFGSSSGFSERPTAGSQEVRACGFWPNWHGLREARAFRDGLNLDSLEFSHSGRSLLDKNESSGSTESYPPDLFTKEQVQGGAIVLYIIGVLYMFIALAIVCDEFFVPALEVLAGKLHLQEDVAGATLMAAGGSAPELFTSFIGTFLAESNVGIGTIVGSAVFNVLFVIAMCAIFSKTLLDLTWFPLARDSTFYTIDLIVLAIFFADQEIQWWEALVLFILYLAYVAFMTVNSNAEQWARDKVRSQKKEKREINFHVGALQFMLGAITFSGLEGGIVPQRSGDEEDTVPLEAPSSASSGSDQSDTDGAEADDDEEEKPLSLAFPEGLRPRITYFVSFPLMVVMFFTLPDVRRPMFRNWFPLTFFGSIAWIGVFSYFMVWWAQVTGDAIGIPPAVMGLTFLAAGTSVPDLLTSVIVARQGYGDMAVSSSIGSNIFDITVGLPLPWLIYAAVNGKPVSVQSSSLFYSIIVLIMMLVAVILTIALCKWKLSKGLGATMVVLYCLFVVQSLLLEYGVVTL